MTTQDCDRNCLTSVRTSRRRKRTRTYDASATVELGKAQESSDGVVIHMQECYGPRAVSRSGAESNEKKKHEPRGFFFKTRKTVSRSSRYLKK